MSENRPKMPNLSWRQWALVGFGGLLAVATIYSAAFPVNTSPNNQGIKLDDSIYETPPAAATSPTADQLARKQDCENRWLQAERAGIVLGTRSAGGVPQVVVDEDTFRSVDFATKSGFAETLNCAAYGDGRSFAAIEFLSNRTNRKLARWTAGRGLVVY
jgi:hypothetical protein